jgi:16S rRNA (guanine527-N7)-methyltransferase
MEVSRIAERLRPFLQSSVSFSDNSKLAYPADEKPAELSSAQLRSISTYIDILLRWNARMNLTAIREPEEIVTRHFGESFFTARHLFSFACSDASVPSVVADSRRVADIGSGAGFPGIPIKLWAPEISMTLVESNQKKATFLREVIRALTLTGIDVRNARAESMPQAAFDVVTLRAVERFELVLPIAAALVRPNGKLALLLGATQPSAASTILVDWKFSQPCPIPESRSRVVLIGNRRQD